MNLRYSKVATQCKVAPFWCPLATFVHWEPASRYCDTVAKSSNTPGKGGKGSTGLFVEEYLARRNRARLESPAASATGSE